MCRQLQLQPSGPVLDDLIDYCDANRDGLINFVEFANFLCWKEMMPINAEEERVLTEGRREGGAVDGGSETLLGSDLHDGSCWTSDLL